MSPEYREMIFACAAILALMGFGLIACDGIGRLCIGIREWWRNRHSKGMIGKTIGG